jgi:hypothetical protein
VLIFVNITRLLKNHMDKVFKSSSKIDLFSHFHKYQQATIKMVFHLFVYTQYTLLLRFLKNRSLQRKENNNMIGRNKHDPYFGCVDAIPHGMDAYLVISLREQNHPPPPAAPHPAPPIVSQKTTCTTNHIKVRVLCGIFRSISFTNFPLLGEHFIVVNHRRTKP